MSRHRQPARFFVGLNESTNKSYANCGRKAAPAKCARGRARKRQLGQLRSQQQADEDGDPSASLDMRGRSIADAMEENSAFVRNGTAAWPDCGAWRPKSMFDLYYKLVRVVERHEWETFHGSLRRPLAAVQENWRHSDPPSGSPRGGQGRAASVPSRALPRSLSRMCSTRSRRERFRTCITHGRCSLLG